MVQLIKGVVDTQKNSYRSIGQVSAGDDLELELEVKMNGQPIEFINPECELLIKKSDNNKVRQTKDIIYQDGKFKIKVDEQGVTYPGIVSNQLVINDEGRVSTCLFYFNVGASLEREVLQSISKVETLEQLDEYVVTAFSNLDEYETRLTELDGTMKTTNEEITVNESERKVNESERKTNETLRIENEKERVKKENERSEAEIDRKESELDRIKNENARRIAENTRIARENARENAEVNRNAIFEENEVIRNEAEKLREKAEAKRKENFSNLESLNEKLNEAEAERVRAEGNRESKETERQLAESEREKAEANRENTYTNFNDAEVDRRNNENARIQAENLRVQAESIRSERFETAQSTRETKFEESQNTRDELFKASETARATEEIAREKAESIREGNEAIRVNSESLRESAENARQQEEIKRSQAEVLRVEAEKERELSYEEIKKDNSTFKDNINSQYEDIVTEFDKVIANVTNGNENATNSEIVQARGKEVNLNARLDNFDEQLDNKANDTDLKVLETRMDTFTSLKEDSTTGDAELIDSRLDSSGNVFDNVGKNIRNIDYMLKSIFKHTEIINETITTQSKSLYYNFKIGKYYKISITCPATYSFSFKKSGKLNTIISNKTKNTEGLYFYCDKAYTEVITYSNPTSELKLIISELSIDNSNINLLNNIDENSLANLDNVSRIFISRELLNFKFTSSPNTQKCEFKKGVKYKFNVNSNDITYSISLLPSYPSVTGYIPIIPNTNQSKNDFEYIPEQDFTGIMVWNSTPASGTIDVQITTDSVDGKLVYEEIESELKNIYSAYFGDSITSDDVTGIGTRVAEILGCKLTGNFAIGASTCSDFHNNDTNLSEVNLSRPSNTYASINVLSNQVRRCLQYTTAAESQIIWKHKLDGSFNIDTAKGVGLGNTDKIPNFIYIAIGTNDGIDSKTEVVDDTSTVFSQTYSQLTRLSLASALRWAIETLQCAYPKAKIFVASPLQTSRTEGNFSYNSNLQKRNIIEKVCQFCSVEFIDSFSRSGYSTFRANDNGDGIHPGADWKERIAQFIANEIRNKYVVNS